ncbi:mitochondrial translation release factor in rescue [Lucilia cuprina]|uniref:mitochondrial translation release factor in rescue n=1 Tax=Lucilia cuprina TaxID=7375 RepID=UPI001F05810A|nr:mitochondrial translation release factor in rescue [Lucilia cuprina]
MISLLSSLAKQNLSLMVKNTKPISSRCLTTTFILNSKQQQLDYSRYPKLNEEELEEHFTRGSGPGGQAVNKTSNCVLLRHIPTNILVKCHTHRLASRNRIEARKILLEKLDVHYNGEHSIQAQLKALENKKSNERKRRQNKLQEMKQKWKEREEQELMMEDTKYKE